ncbi:hypothetical protein [Haloarcula sp. CBA1127]|uniref:DUF7344 domain-containing protein n=1 Tax=Haloarcula sp. CBA1127 TaxID=1765055 RepID=UPI00073F7A9A|nr:hypothetical protein [Haloarcula sp. CBA1127]
MSSNENSKEIPQEKLFDILGNRRRRIAVHLLQEEGAMSMTDLAERVASIEFNSSVENLEGKERKRVYVALFQTHVPKLEEVGLVEYDQDQGFVEATDVLLDLQYNVRVEKGKTDKIFFTIRGIIVIITSFVIISTISPSITGVEIGTPSLAVIMILISITLSLTYYAEKLSGPNISDIDFKENV